MKRVLMITALIVMVLLCRTPTYGALTYGRAHYEANIAYITSPNFNNPLWNLVGELDDKVGAFGTTDTGGTTFYVDGNKSNDNGDGLSWENATQKLSTAMALSHADITVSADRAWASRNRIYCKGDTITEDLTALAQKTDIIGVGNNNPYNMCGLLGNHVIASTTAYPSCRFYNMQFYGDQAGKVWDVDGQAGLEFQGCLFQANGTATIGLEASECTLLVVNGNEFGSADGVDFSTAAIKIPNDTTPGPNIRITKNNIKSDGIGIDYDETDILATGVIISGNTIRSAGLAIDDESDYVWVIDNRMITLGYGKAAFDFSMVRASGNTLTTPVRTTPIPYTNECAGAVAAAQRGSFGTIYYVDRNMAATGGDGLTWETACQSLKTAMAKSHANIAVSAQRGWSQRNTIYMRGDVMTEDHIVLAQKTDIVGVGSSNYNDRPYVIGTWVIPNTDSWMGCHFYNLYFKDDGAGGVLFQVALQGGLQFHNCTFEAAATDTIGLQLTNTHLDVKIDNCDFVRVAGASFSTSAIKIVDSTNLFTTGITISNNRIYSNGIGIDWDETTDVFDCWITDNYFKTAGMCVDSEDAVGLMVMNNKMLCTGAAVADNASNDFNILWAVNNQVTGNDSSLHIPTYSDD